MAKCTIAKTSSKALLRRIGAKPLKKVPAHRCVLRRSIKKFVYEQWDIREEMDRQAKMKKKMEKEARLQAFFNRMAEKTDRMLKKEMNNIQTKNQVFSQLETLCI